MKTDFNGIDGLIPGYFTGELPIQDREAIDKWRKESQENEKYFLENMRAWEAISLLNEMEQFNSFEALKKVNTQIEMQKSKRWFMLVQRAAAVIIIPVLIYSGFITFQFAFIKGVQTDQAVVQTVSATQGMVTRFKLADGTKVWLNSGSTLQFPTSFNGDFREVKLTGEAFFEVEKNENQPFRVRAKDLYIEDLGTSFDVLNYDEEKQVEVILVEGEVRLSSGIDTDEKILGTINPGQRAIFKQNNQNLETEDVNVDKYIAWRNGNLIFHADKMEDVIKRLSRWFNVEIIINDPEIRSYEYDASFRNETLIQVLDLLKISAPIDYQITGGKLLPNGEYTKQKVFLTKQK